ncbi:putative yir3 protein [Plasmodium yoelii yoelii]|uniref:Yir3 protein n=1 Tax=Plasmodium yoelii yoelii TaxID=73239 RepID=Q7RP10_PLAYO|nr:putative yir3 protein [Plasmodium yoelii yoelii]
MNKEVCEKFQEVRNSLSDKLSNGSYNFKDDKFLNDYCNSNQCQSYFDRISAGCLYLLYQFYNDSGIFPSPKNNNRYIVDYILIWLSYMLNLTNSEEDNIKSFYSAYINSCDQYKTQINELSGYDNYKDLIDERKDLLYMDSNIVSKFYEALKSLCKLYNELGNNKNCENYLEDNEFDKKYNDLKDSDITNSSIYKEMLSTLSTDYEHFKKECKHILSPPPEKTKENLGQTLVRSSGQDVDYLGQNVDYLGQDVGGLGQDTNSFEQNADNSDVASSSSSIVSKLIPVLLIIGAIPIFLGISYKVNNKELKNYFHYIYVNVNKKIIHFLTFYISIRYLDFGNDLQNI